MLCNNASCLTRHYAHTPPHTGGLPSQVPLRPPPPPPTSYRLLYEGGALAARGGGWSRIERRNHVLACDDTRRLNRNMASLKADFLLKKQVRCVVAGVWRGVGSTWWHGMS